MRGFDKIARNQVPIFQENRSDLLVAVAHDARLKVGPGIFAVPIRNTFSSIEVHHNGAHDLSKGPLLPVSPELYALNLALHERPDNGCAKDARYECLRHEDTP